MAAADKPSEVSSCGTFEPRPSLLPSYSEILREEHAEDLMVSNSAILLRVTKLDDSGKQVDIKWKCEDKVSNASNQAHNSQGYGIIITALFIIGEMVGGGIISMPNALCRQGWGGIAVIIIIGMISGFTGIQLGQCWIILQERWPEIYLKHSQKPYPEIGYRAGGKWCQRVVSVSLNLTLIGTATVFLIIVGQNVTQLLESWAHTNISFCYFTLVVAAILLPVTYLGSPKDFWPVSFGAAISTTIAVIIMIIGMSLQWPKNEGHVDYPAPSFLNFLLGYGTIVFAFSGQSAFPTIQHDMKNPRHFSKAILGSYSIIFFYYLPATILGFLVYGSQLEATGVQDVLTLLPPGWVQDTVTVLITLHVMFGYIIFVNPVNQELEAAFGIPARFGIKRVLLRTAVAVFVVFLAESIPAMNLLLDLVGGTTMAFLSLVFPGTFNLALRWRTKTEISDVDRPIRNWEYPVTLVIVLIGILGAIGSVYAFISTIADGDALFKLPCYVNGGE